MFAGVFAKTSIVGYQTITVARGSTTAMGVQFQAVDGAAGIPIKSLLTVSDPRGATSASSGADQIWTFDGHTWAKYYYYRRSSTTTPKWCLSTDSTKTEIGDDVVLKPGQAFFFVRSDSDLATEEATITLSGGVVPLTSQVSYNIAKGSTTAMAWPWPEALKIKDFNNYNPDPRGSTSATSGADQIWTFDGHTWAKYYYYRRSSTTTPKWCLSTDSTKTEIGDDVVITSGQAFFFVRSDSDVATDNVTITFAR